MCHWVEDRVSRYRRIQELLPFDVAVPGRGWLQRLNWAGGGSPSLGFSRWEFQPPIWRNGLGEHQDPQADVVGSARSLAMTA